MAVPVQAGAKHLFNQLKKVGDVDWQNHIASYHRMRANGKSHKDAFNMLVKKAEAAKAIRAGGVKVTDVPNKIMTVNPLGTTSANIAAPIPLSVDDAKDMLNPNSIPSIMNRKKAKAK